MSKPTPFANWTEEERVRFREASIEAMRNAMPSLAREDAERILDTSLEEHARRLTDNQ